MIKMKHNHIWKEIESDNLGRPIKYQCIDCTLIRVVKKDVKAIRYFDKVNSIHNRIGENIQKIEFIKLNSIGTNGNLHLNHLIKENKLFEILLNQ